jgi:hypothetical protein
MEILKKIDIKNFNFYTILSILILIAGIFLYIDWIIRYGIIYDLGIYSLVIVFIIGGIIGFILSLLKKEEIKD